MLEFSDLPGNSYRIGRLEESPSGALERVDEWTARSIVRELASHDVINVCRRVRDVEGDDAEYEWELREWLDRELSGPAASLTLWCVRRPLHASSTTAPQPVAPLLTELTEPVVELSWIAFRVLDSDGQPVPDVGYELTLVDGAVIEGSTDRDGYVRHDAVTKGTCALRFGSSATSADTRW